MFCAYRSMYVGSNCNRTIVCSVNVLLLCTYILHILFICPDYEALLFSIYIYKINALINRTKDKST